MPSTYASLDDLIKAKNALDDYAHRSDALKEYLLADFQNPLSKIADTLAQHEQGEIGEHPPDEPSFVLKLTTDAASRVDFFNKAIDELQVLQGISEKQESKDAIASAIKDLGIYQNLFTPPPVLDQAAVSLNDAAKLHLQVLSIISDTTDLMTSDWKTDDDIKTAADTVNTEIVKAYSLKSQQIALRDNVLLCC